MYLLNKLKDFYRQLDFSKANETSALLVYKDVVERKKIYQININLGIKKAIAQIKLLNLYNTRIILWNKCHIVRKNLNCEACDIEGVTFLHFALECAEYRYLRIKYKIDLPIGREEGDNLSGLALLFDNGCETKFTEVCRFFVEILENLTSETEN